MAMDGFKVVLYYKYVALGETQQQVQYHVSEQEELCLSLGLKGRVRMAQEGINGTLGGTRANVDEYIARMKASQLYDGIDWKTSSSDVEPFEELQVRLVQEIVAMGIPDEQCDLAHGGQHLTPEQFHQAQQQGDSFAIIDVRNTYEYNIGHFEGAVNPKTRRFAQFPDWVQSELPTLQAKDKVLMYCTGGIRCEKASAYLKHLGLPRVYQLQGGIHRYLEQFPDGGLFQGKNFVFDQRVTMASQDETVAGKCEVCQTPYDAISGTRCSYCRMHVMLCDTCRENIKSSAVFCVDHEHLVQGDLTELKIKCQALYESMQTEQGRAKKGKRRSLRKQLDVIERRIHELSLEGVDESIESISVP